MEEGKAAWQRSCCAFLVRRNGAEVRVGCACPNRAPGTNDISASGVFSKGSPGVIREKSALPAVSQSEAQPGGDRRLLEMLKYDHEAAAHTGQLRTELARAGLQIGPYAQVIAG